MSERIGFFVSWRLPRYIAISKVKEACERYHITFKLPKRNEAARVSVYEAIRSVFPGASITSATKWYGSRKGMRYQVDKKRRVGKSWVWETVEVVRIYANRELICEMSVENENKLISFFQQRNKLIARKEFGKAIRHYVVNVLHAIPFNHGFIVPGKYMYSLRHLFLLFRFLFAKEHDSDRCGRLYVLTIVRNKNTEVETYWAVAWHITERLTQIVRTALDGGITMAKRKKAIRRRDRLKIVTRDWEIRLNRKLFIVRRAMANIAMEYPELNYLVDEK